MIQADKNYVYGTAAEKLEYNVYEENKVLRAKKKQRANGKVKLKIVFAVLVIFSMCAFAMYRYALITETNYKIVKAAREYNNTKNSNIRLRAEIDRDLDLQKIREVAVQRLGMQKPDRFQIVTVRTDKSDNTRVAEVYKEKEIGESSKYAVFMNKLSKITGLLY